MFDKVANNFYIQQFIILSIPVLSLFIAAGATLHSWCTYRERGGHICTYASACIQCRLWLPLIFFTSFMIIHTPGPCGWFYNQKYSLVAEEDMDTNKLDRDDNFFALESIEGWVDVCGYNRQILRNGDSLYYSSEYLELLIDWGLWSYIYLFVYCQSSFVYSRKEVREITRNNQCSFVNNCWGYFINPSNMVKHAMGFLVVLFVVQMLCVLILSTITLPAHLARLELEVQNHVNTSLHGDFSYTRYQNEGDFSYKNLTARTFKEWLEDVSVEKTYRFNILWDSKLMIARSFPALFACVILTWKLPILCIRSRRKKIAFISYLTLVGWCFWQGFVPLTETSALIIDYSKHCGLLLTFISNAPIYKVDAGYNLLLFSTDEEAEEEEEGTDDLSADGSDFNSEFAEEGEEEEGKEVREGHENVKNEREEVRIILSNTNNSMYDRLNFVQKLKQGRGYALNNDFVMEGINLSAIDADKNIQQNSQHTSRTKFKRRNSRHHQRNTYFRRPTFYNKRPQSDRDLSKRSMFTIMNPSQNIQPSTLQHIQEEENYKRGENTHLHNDETLEYSSSSGGY